MNSRNNAIKMEDGYQVTIPFNNVDNLYNVEFRIYIPEQERLVLNKLVVRVLDREAN